MTHDRQLEMSYFRDIAPNYFPNHHSNSLKSLSSVLSKSLYFYVFLSWTAFHTFLFTEKSRRFLVIFYIFHIKYWFSYYFLFHCIIFIIYIQHWHLVRTEDAQWIDLADEIGMSTNNGDGCIFPNLCDAKHFIKQNCKY